MPNTHGPSASFSLSITGPLGAVKDVDGASDNLVLVGLGNVVLDSTSGAEPETVSGGAGLTTVDLGDGDDHVSLCGAINTVVLGNGNDVVNVGAGRATATVGPNGFTVYDAGLLTARFTDALAWRSLTPASGDIGWFVGGTDNIGAFDGLGDANATSGNGNIGAFEGLGNGGADDGNGNVGAFNGDLNGTGNTDPTDGNLDGNDNTGAFEGNFNGNFVAGSNSGDDNGNGNLGADNANDNGNGTAPTRGFALPGCTMQYTGGFDTVVVGNGNDAITAMAGLSTIVAGDGNDRICIGGALDTVVAGNGADIVYGTGTPWAVVELGNGADRVSLSGGYDKITTGNGNDYISVTGVGNWIDAGSSTTFNEIVGGSGGDTFVIDPGQGYDKIYGFSLKNGDALDIAKFDVSGGWDGKSSDLAHWFATVVSGGNTMLESRSKSGHLSVVAELMGVAAPLTSLEHSLIG